MGQSNSSSSALPADAIQAIIAQTPTSTILEGALFVNKKWNEIGRRNVIWIPRYKQLTGIALDPQDFDEYEVMPLFLKEWYRQTPVWMDNSGNVTDVPEDVEWIDSVRPEHQKSRVFKDKWVIIDENYEFVPSDQVFLIPNTRIRKVLTTRNLKRPELFLFIAAFGETLQVKQLDFYRITPRNDLLESLCCTVCAQPAKYKCQACNHVMYCSKECMWEDYKDKSI